MLLEQTGQIQKNAAFIVSLVAPESSNARRRAREVKLLPSKAWNMFYSWRGITKIRSASMQIYHAVWVGFDSKVSLLQEKVEWFRFVHLKQEWSTFTPRASCAYIQSPLFCFCNIIPKTTQEILLKSISAETPRSKHFMIARESLDGKLLISKCSP